MIENKETTEIEKFGTVETPNEKTIENGIRVLTIIGQIEGHYVSDQSQKTTKYEHLIPLLVAMEQSDDVKGVLIILNTMGGDVEAGLGLAEMIASMSKPTVSLVLGGSHSIGVPLAVSTDYSFIVDSGTLLIHPVRMGGMVIGAPQSYAYFKRIQDRITEFIARHSQASKERLEEMMMDNTELTKDLGTILVGEEAVREGLINEVGGIDKALAKLKDLIREKHDE
jgi:ATP-dependent protease ClpP protease subunit